MDKILGLLLMLFMISNGYTCTMFDKKQLGVGEKNSIEYKYAPEYKFGLNRMNKYKFLKVINAVEEVYRPIFEELDYDIRFDKLWDSNLVKATASYDKKTLVVTIHGGVGRVNVMTEDSLALVVCHEIGHHIAGRPLYEDKSWMSVEGQADYWAALKCFRRVHYNDDNRRIMRVRRVSDTVKEKCEKIWKKRNQIALCERIAMAGEALSKSLFGTDISFDTPSKFKTNVTNQKHPSAQCRLDTYFQASLCTESFENYIDMNFFDVDQGQCSRFYRNNDIGSRPLCWYRVTGSPIAH